MVDVGFAKSPLQPHEIERYPRLGELTRAASSRSVALLPQVADSPELSEHDREPNAGTIVNLRKLQEALARGPLEEIADLVHALTYGEMIEFSDAVWTAQPTGTSITRENLPRLLHLWSKSHVAHKARTRKGAGTQAVLDASAIDPDPLHID